jgi:tRNA A37 threonylcarbamoyladenosine dehydratase
MLSLLDLEVLAALVQSPFAELAIGELTLIDFDLVDKTDLNRQIIALHSTLGQSKVEVLSKRTQRYKS